MRRWSTMKVARMAPPRNNFAILDVECHCFLQIQRRSFLLRMKRPEMRNSARATRGEGYHGINTKLMEHDPALKTSNDDERPSGVPLFTCYPNIILSTMSQSIVLGVRCLVILRVRDRPAI